MTFIKMPTSEKRNMLAQKRIQRFWAQTHTHLYNKLKTILRKNADKPKQLETQLKSKRWERLQNCCRGVIFLRTTTKNNYFVRLAGVMMSCAYFITHLPKIELPCFFTSMVAFDLQKYYIILK